MNFYEESGEPALTFKTQLIGQASMRRLMPRLREAAAKESPLKRGLPIAIEVLYRVGSQAWRGYRNQDFKWHLAAPSATAIADLCCDVLSVAGIVAPGQVVSTHCFKELSLEEGMNHLEVRCFVLAGTARPDIETKRHRFLLWYIRKSEMAGREPTKNGYYAILRKLRQGKNAKSKFSAFPPEANMENVGKLLEQYSKKDGS